MLCRRHAFAADSLLSLLYQIVRGSYPPVPADLFSSDMQQLVGQLLTHDAAQRPSLPQVSEQEPAGDTASLSAPDHMCQSSAAAQLVCQFRALSGKVVAGAGAVTAVCSEPHGAFQCRGEKAHPVQANKPEQHAPTTAHRTR